MRERLAAEASMPSKVELSKVEPGKTHLCYITDRKAFPGDEATRRRLLLAKIAEAANAGVDYIQLREKDLCSGELEKLAREAVRIVRQGQTPTSILINSRVDIALAVGAHGVHLPANDISPREVQAIRKAARQAPANFTISVACHSVEDVRRAESEGANFAVLAPIFEKTATSAIPLGLQMLKDACAGRLPIFALGGVTLENSGTCLEAGATGIAAIRLFQNNNVKKVIA